MGDYYQLYQANLTKPIVRYINDYVDIEKLKG